jgi:predicted phosphoribosyltransferase
MHFEDRRDAGRQLAITLAHFKARADVVVLALPRGGVPVGFEVAQTLNAPLDVFVVRKLGVPGQEELAMGAIASGGVPLLNTDVVHELHIPERVIEQVVKRELGELARREREYRGNRPRLDIRGKTVILVDDGLATGSSMRAAARAVFDLSPSYIVIAVPVGAPAVCDEMKSEIGVDELVVLFTPEPFSSVGEWYRNFDQVTDDEVREMLARAFENSSHRAA